MLRMEMVSVRRDAVRVAGRLAMVAVLMVAGVAAAGGQSAVGAQSALAGAAASRDATWWKHAVIYEIYPRSLQDSNGDGVGDLNGIRERLGYLEKLGVDAIWIAPMYPSPQVDFGYDISNYEAVDPQYGTMADFDRLVAAAGEHHIRVILDMVLNHTSDQHRWFEEAASSRTNPKHDWYCWSDGKPGTGPGSHDGRVPPNNWVSMFGGSAWEWVPAVKQFYYHQFYKQQPDLNWRNPQVEKEMFGEMQFWLDKGVAGFRLDAIDQLFEDAQLRDEPEMGGVDLQGDKVLNTEYTTGLPEVHDVLRRLRAMVAKYPGDRVLIGETYTSNTAELDRYYGGAAKDELQLPMDMVVAFRNSKLDAAEYRKSIEAVETGVQGSQPLLVFDNHDNVRSWDRFGDGESGGGAAAAEPGDGVDVLRSGDWDADLDAGAEGRCEGPDRDYGVAEGKGEGWGTDADAVDCGAGCGVFDGGEDVAADSAELQDGECADGDGRCGVSAGVAQEADCTAADGSGAA
jgi:alpha-glucosidase